MNPLIFREYDIRGVVARDLSGDVATQIGRAFASEIRSRVAEASVVVGHDNRPSSPELARLLITGLREAGANVITVGTVPTPVLYYAAASMSTAGAVQITGSHNPPEYNGFKLLVETRSLYGPGIQRLRERIERSEFTKGSGSEEAREIIGAYIDDLAGRFSLARPIRAVVDCGNGTGSLVAVSLLRAVGVEVIPLYCESDGTFPNHHPDPTVDENVRDLIERVGHERADLGIAFDGDADRIGVVDEHGRIVRGDMLVLLFGLDALERLGAPQRLVYDVKCSKAVAEVYAAHGGEPIMWKTGHSLIKEKMKEVGAPVAGELSGHICFGEDYYGFDDALYGACALAQLLAADTKPLSDRIAEFPSYASTPEIRVEVDEQRKFEIVEKAVRHFSRDHEVLAVDGARVTFDGGWGLLRASNTQPVLVLRYEADTEQQLNRIRETMEAWLAEQGIS